MKILFLLSREYKDKLSKAINIKSEQIKKSGTFIWDAMVLTHTVLNKKRLASKGGKYNFADAMIDIIASGIQSAVTLDSKVVHLVFDPYPENPIPKGLESISRQKNKHIMLMTILPSGSNAFPVADPDGFLALACNKRRLIKFIIDSLQSGELQNLMERSKMTTDMLLIVSNGCCCLKVSWCLRDNCWICDHIEELVNNHDEADTMLILHLKYAITTSSEKPNIYIRSVDTDVLVLTMANCNPMYVDI